MQSLDPSTYRGIDRHTMRLIGSRAHTDFTYAASKQGCFWTGQVGLP